MTSQLRRCSSSIPANLAEGCGRNGDAGFARFCHIAMVRQANWNITCCRPET
ncbi:MAG: four helix bundle protein [Bryobacterales bacterium]|nr:four helix bundle protein [Bryobacterales bacterium]